MKLMTMTQVTVDGVMQAVAAGQQRGQQLRYPLGDLMLVLVRRDHMIDLVDELPEQPGIHIIACDSGIRGLHHGHLTTRYLM